MSNVTNRPTVEAMEAILAQPFKLLDHGFIRVVDYMGDDAAIVQAARVSYGNGTKQVNEDKGLINYLMRHWHSTPFEMCEIKLHIKLPIFVARQWIRHRTANVNEYSARYSKLDKEYYIPEPAQLSPQSKTNAQGREINTLTAEESVQVLALLRNDAERAYDGYTEMLNESNEGEIIDPSRNGLARELARMNLSLNYYTQWYWKIDLHNLFHFLMLRADPHAQYEIRVYAEELLNIVKAWCPWAYEAFVEHRLNGARLSASGLDLVRQMLDGGIIDKPDKMSKREFDELMKLLFPSSQSLPL